jgi:hypothetical protein
MPMTWSPTLARIAADRPWLPHGIAWALAGLASVVALQRWLDQPPASDAKAAWRNPDADPPSTRTDILSGGRDPGAVDRRPDAPASAEVVASLLRQGGAAAHLDELHLDEAPARSPGSSTTQLGVTFHAPYADGKRLLRDLLHSHPGAAVGALTLARSNGSDGSDAMRSSAAADLSWTVSLQWSGHAPMAPGTSRCSDVARGIDGGTGGPDWPGCSTPAR